MLHIFVRYAKRLAVLLPGLVIAFVSINNIYPILDRRIPAGVAFLVTYILAAYVLIPALTRVVRWFYKPRHLPLYCITPDGYASDPINVGIIGTRSQLVAAMTTAGWEKADEHSLSNVWREVVCSLLRVAYPAAPMSSLYLFGRKQDVGFEIQVESRMWHRHHVRFWATRYDEDEAAPLERNDIQWFPKRLLKQSSNQRFLWLGAASKDVGLALIKHNAQLTHMIHPDTDAERDLIVDQLQIDGATLKADLKITKPYTLANRAWSGFLRTDGQLKILSLPVQSQD